VSSLAFSRNCRRRTLGSIAALCAMGCGGGATAPRPVFDSTVVCAVEPCVQRLVPGGAGQFFYALLADGSARAWGQNSNGQLGVPSRKLSDGLVFDDFHTQSDWRPTPIGVPDLPEFVELAEGNVATCGLTGDREVWCWGGMNWALAADDPNRYDPGDGGIRVQSRPVYIPGFRGAEHLAIGANHLCALRAGQVLCWGSNSDDALGIDSPTAYPASVPTAVGGLGRAKQVVADSESTCAVLVDGTVWCWGRHWPGQKRTSFGYTSSPTPQKLVGLSGVASFATSDHGCALLENGDVMCLGSSGNGQAGVDLSQASDDVLATPQRIELAVPSVQVVVGGAFSCALGSDERVRCWGIEWNGDLGNGNRAAPHPGVPVPSTDLAGVVQVVARLASACALFRSGEVRCWGANTRGELGNGIPDPETSNASDFTIGGNQFTPMAVQWQAP